MFMFRLPMLGLEVYPGFEISGLIGIKGLYGLLIEASVHSALSERFCRTVRVHTGSIRKDCVWRMGMKLGLRLSSRFRVYNGSIAIL